MVTTFFGSHSFGGDAAFVDRLSRALLRNGHEVDVIYSVDAFRAVQGAHPDKVYHPPEGLGIYPLQFAGGFLDALWTHQTGRMGRKHQPLSEIWKRHPYDVVHFHNVSLMGAPQIFVKAAEQTDAVKLMTVSEHWLICPLSLLWKFKRKTCDKKRCFRCTVYAGRPPQLWRASGKMRRSVEQYLDGLIFPSHHTLELHRREGFSQQMFHLPYFLPDDGSSHTRQAKKESKSQRPYFAAAGRLVREKGLQNLIPLMERFPDHDLRIAGTGPYEKNLHRLARNRPNVHFIGLVDSSGIQALFKNAVAVLVPSLFYETFGYVALEAFAVGTPVIVNDHGALPELIEASGAGVMYNTAEELVRHMRTFVEDPKLQDLMGQKGLACRNTLWSEKTHMERYFAIIDVIQCARDGSL